MLLSVILKCMRERKRAKESERMRETQRERMVIRLTEVDS